MKITKKQLRDIAIGAGIGILASMIIRGPFTWLIIILSAIGGVIGGNKIDKWWGALVGGAGIFIIVLLLIGIYLLLMLLGVPLAQ